MSAPEQTSLSETTDPEKSEPAKTRGKGRKFLLSLALGLAVGLAGLAGAVWYLVRSL